MLPSTAMYSVPFPGLKGQDRRFAIDVCSDESGGLGGGMGLGGRWKSAARWLRVGCERREREVDDEVDGDGEDKR